MPSPWRSAIVAATMIAACAAPATSPTDPPTPVPTCQAEAATAPSMTMQTASGDDIAGEVALSTFCGALTDFSSFAPFDVVALTDSELNIVLSVADGPAMTAWNVWYGTSWNGPQSGSLANDARPGGVESISFAGPPTGEWTVVARVSYPGDMGSVTYVWQVRAP